MTQRAVPIEDTHIDDWENDVGNMTDLFASLSSGQDDPNPPTSFQDDTFIVSEPTPANDVYVTKLSEVINPQDLGESWTIHVRARNMKSGAEQLDLTVELREEYVDEADPGSLIIAETFEDIAATYTNFDIELPVPDPDIPDGDEFDPSVTDMDNLFVRLVANTS